MLPFQIKVCGVSIPDDAKCALDSGAQAIGLNFYKKSIRYVDRNAAQAVCAAVDDCGIANAKKIGVFVNETPQDVIETMDVVGLNGIQLHGDEEPTSLDQFRDLLGDRFATTDFVRAIRSNVNSNANISNETVSNETSEFDRVVGLIEQWSRFENVSILIDAKVPGTFGGTGEKVDWNSVPALVKKSGRELILAGGLDPWNIAEAIKVTSAKAVDVASGVESVPGTKDQHRIKKFVAKALDAMSV
jgi:phosphoribosylanthranilate isomerase